MNYGQTYTNNLARAEQRRVAAGAGVAMLSRLTVGVLEIAGRIR